jgi:hypothetical protein
VIGWVHARIRYELSAHTSSRCTQPKVADSDVNGKPQRQHFLRIVLLISTCTKCVGVENRAAGVKANEVGYVRTNGL